MVWRAVAMVVALMSATSAGFAAEPEHPLCLPGVVGRVAPADTPADDSPSAVAGARAPLGAAVPQAPAGDAAGEHGVLRISGPLDQPRPSN